MGPSCSNKAGQITYLREKCSLLNTLFSIQISCHPLFNQYNALQLNFQYYKSVCTIMHYVSNNSLPANIVYSTQVHSCNTRFSETGSLNIKCFRTNQLQHSFSRFDARIWNSIHQTIRVLLTHKFKTSPHQLLLHILKL